MLSFDGEPELGAGVAASLTSAIREARPNWSVLERAEVDRVLAEIKLSMTDIVDPDHRVQAGKFLGARYLVFGNVQEVGGKVRLTARLVEVETGRVVAAAVVFDDLDKLFDLETQLAGQLLRGMP
ncbi:CsgG/HfaB family protein [Geothermobacter hydrogeniphilus]|uniref:CsgG/HfaB family protein n=1 Tax=Geothermobacter hydrogeniphilus TaxID=1969733 RepID=UPI001304C450|nr:CsgG/HfaB family protein [Geothermobacter hydrogeniphilus]